MRRLRIYTWSEGPTEQEFVLNVLQPHLGASVDFFPRLTQQKEKRMGGVPKYSRLKRDLTAALKEDGSNDAYCTCMFDLYRLPGNYPGWKSPQEEPNPVKRAHLVEEAMLEDIGGVRSRFIPYIQIYEFEALLFAEREAIEKAFPDQEDTIKKLWVEAADSGGPEEINDQTPPAKLLKKHFPTYSKRLDGPSIYKHLTLDIIRAKCPHFDEWVRKLEALGDAP